MDLSYNDFSLDMGMLAPLLAAEARSAEFTFCLDDHHNLIVSIVRCGADLRLFTRVARLLPGRCSRVALSRALLAELRLIFEIDVLLYSLYKSRPSRSDTYGYWQNVCIFLN